MLAIGIVGGICMGLHLRQVLSHFISAHSEHAIVLNVAAAGWDTDSGASRVPIHITGKTIDGITVDRIEFIAPDVAALCQAAIGRRDGANISGNAFESCGEIRIN